MTHTEDCLSRAVGVVIDELDDQGVAYTAYTGEVPAWATTIDELAQAWLADGTTNCHCP